MNKLLPCPFCGANPEMEIIGNAHTPKRSVVVKCPQCRIKRTDSGIILTIETLAIEATKRWNQRITNDPNQTVG